jgi:hypothetical protein
MDRGVACRLRLKMILRLAKGEAGFCGDDLDCLRSKLGVGIDTGPDSRAAKEQVLADLSTHLGYGRLRALRRFEWVRNLAVMRRRSDASGQSSQSCSKASAFCFRARSRRINPGKKVFADRFKRGYVNRDRNNIVARLPHIQMIVRVYLFAATSFTNQFDERVSKPPVVN